MLAAPSACSKVIGGDELIHAHASLPDNRAECAAIKFFMIGNCGLSFRISAYQRDMTTALPVDDEARFL